MAFSSVVAAGEFSLDPRQKPAFDFWIDVFSKYGEETYILHDEFHLGVVYSVLNFSGQNLSDGVKRARAEREKERIQNALIAIQKKGADAANLTPFERELQEKWPSSYGVKRFQEASTRVRIQKGALEKCREGVVRSGRYMDRFGKIFRDHGLPEELTALPFVESSFRQDAVSPAGAVGMWQFMSYTGSQFMRIDRTVDERLDPFLAAEAAAKLLKNNYELLQSWPLAVTAYNYGANGMKRAKNSFGGDLQEIIEKYKEKRFGFAARNFWVELLAAIEVMRSHRDYYGPIIQMEPASFVEFELPDRVKLSDLEAHFDVSPQQLAALNPALGKSIREGRIPAPSGYRLRLPETRSASPTETYASMPSGLKKPPAPANNELYVVRKGDSLGKIAGRYGVSVDGLMEVNRIHNPHKIHVGQKLVIPFH